MKIPVDQESDADDTFVVFLGCNMTAWPYCGSAGSLQAVFFSCCSSGPLQYH